MHADRPAGVGASAQMSSSVTRAFFGLGSNLGDRPAMLREAVRLLTAGIPRSQEIKPSCMLSSIYETSPVGTEGIHPPYLNAVIGIDTQETPESLLETALAVEERLGRIRKVRWEPRTIDIDLLLYGAAIIDKPGLTVPHPRLHERRFVLEPLSEVAGNLIHPLLEKTIRELAVGLRRAVPDQAVSRIHGADGFGLDTGLTL